MVFKFHASLFSILVFVIISLPSSAQENNYKIEASYLMTWRPDSTNHDELKTEDMVLYIGEQQSFFVAKKLLLMDSAMTSELNKGNIYGPPMSFYIANGTKINMAIFKNSSSVLYYDHAQIFTSGLYTYTEKKPLFNWEILPDTMNIIGLNCQKAIATYGNRNWIAWFTNSLPISEGPYKFCGLPGLIISIYDDKQNWTFNLTGLTNINKVVPFNFINKKPKAIKDRITFLAQKEYDRNNRFQIYVLEKWKFSNPEATKKDFEQRAKKDNNWIELYKP